VVLALVLTKSVLVVAPSVEGQMLVAL